MDRSEKLQIHRDFYYSFYFFLNKFRKVHLGVKTRDLLRKMNLRNIGRNKVSFDDLISFSASAYLQPVVLLDLFRYVNAGATWLNKASIKVSKAGKAAETKNGQQWNLEISNLTAKVCSSFNSFIYGV